MRAIVWGLTLAVGLILALQVQGETALSTPPPALPGGEVPPLPGTTVRPDQVVGPDGRRWVEMGHGLRWGIKASHVDVSAEDPQLIYVGTEVGYVFRSIDGGVTWDELRLLPDDVPLVDVSMINLSMLWVPNDGLVDDYVAPIPQGGYRRPDNRGRGRPGAWDSDVLSLGAGFSGMTTPFWALQEEGYTQTYALGGADARVEVEDPANLMASFFRGVSAQIGKVNWLEICPTNTDISFAGTNYGVFRTTDRGLTWDRVYIGSDIWENQIRCVHCHPEDENKVFISTAAGVRYSVDGGLEWTRPPSNVGIWPGFYVTTHPLDYDVVLVGTDLGAYKTSIGSDTQEPLFLQDTPSPLVRIVTMIKGTTDPNIYYATTLDGASYSHDGGETWHRLGEFLIGRYKAWSVQVDPRNPLHAYIMTDWHVFETKDGGRSIVELWPTWSELFAATIDPLDPERFWLLGMSQLWAYEKPRPAPARPSALAQRARAALARDPGYPAVVERVMEQAGIDDATTRQYMRRIRYSAFLPAVNLVGWMYHGAGNLAILGPGLPKMYSPIGGNPACGPAVGANDYNFCHFSSNPYNFLAHSPYDQTNYGAFVVLSWPVGRVLWDERMTGRIWLDMFRMRDRLITNIALYWNDRRRLLDYLAAGTATPAEEQAYQLRLAEMTAVMDALSGGFLGGPFGDDPREEP
jgi:photosystem II stability/assembly factor-like uncharacterized protein